MRNGLLPVAPSNKSQTPNFTILTNISAKSTHLWQTTASQQPGRRNVRPDLTRKIRPASWGQTAHRPLKTLPNFFMIFVTPLALSGLRNRNFFDLADDGFLGCIAVVGTDARKWGHLRVICVRLSAVMTGWPNGQQEKTTGGRSQHRQTFFRISLRNAASIQLATCQDECQDILLLLSKRRNKM